MRPDFVLPMSRRHWSSPCPLRECWRHGHRTRFLTRDAPKARTKPAADRASFVIADCAAPPPLRDGIFERVVCALLADHVPSLDSLVSELARICSHDGFITFTTVYPTMHLLGVRAVSTIRNRAARSIRRVMITLSRRS